MPPSLPRSYPCAVAIADASGELELLRVIVNGSLDFRRPVSALTLARSGVKEALLNFRSGLPGFHHAGEQAFAQMRGGILH